MKKPRTASSFQVLGFSVRKAGTLLLEPNISVKPQRGFTLIEMMVAVSIFAMVMMIGVGALLSLVEANRRAQALNSVMNNLNAALEGMSRSIRIGTDYHCGETGDLSQPRDCNDIFGDSYFAFEAAPGSFEADVGKRGDPNDQVVYRLNSNRIQRSLQSGQVNSWVPLTASEVKIERLTFYVVGAPQGDHLQPRVVLRVEGSATTGKITTTFNVQTTVTQRIIDI